MEAIRGIASSSRRRTGSEEQAKARKRINGFLITLRAGKAFSFQAERGAS